MQQNEITYAGYRVSTEGLAVWPKRILRYRWSELASITSVLLADRRSWQTVLIFTVGGELKLAGARAFTFSGGIGRYAELLEMACAHAPDTAEIDELTRDLSRWGPRPVRHRTAQYKGVFAGADHLLEKAENQRAWLEHKRALKTVRQALLVAPDHADANRLYFVLLDETGARPAVLLAAANRWAMACPRDTQARTMRGIAGLRAGDHTIAGEVAVWLEREPEQAGLTSALSDYYFKHGDFEAARLLWERLSSVTTDVKVRRVAEGNITYLQRYATSPLFRGRERSKRYVMVAIVWIPLLLIFAAQGYRVWRAWHPPQVKRDPQMERRLAEMRESIERNNRWLQENTGLVAGTDAQLRARAATGDAAAQYTLSFNLLRDKGNPEHVHEGLAFLESAAALHYRWALLDLAEYLDEGNIIGKDSARAVALYDEAATLGSPRAARLAGEHYREGNGVTKNPVKALAYFEQSAKGGNPQGKAWMGFVLEQGEGTEVNLPEAVRYYRQAAEDKDQWAMERLVSILYAKEYGPYDPGEAEKWVHQGAEVGSKHLRLIAITLLMQKTDRSPEEVTRALGWLDEQIRDGDAAAIYLRGRLAWEGTMVPVDRADAVERFRLAAEKKYPQALLQMAWCHAFGVGVERDPAKAKILRDQCAATAMPPKFLTQLDEALIALSRSSPTPVPADQIPRPIWRQRPEYPLALRIAGVTGSALIQFDVTVDGFTKNITVIRATKPEFGIAAVNSILFWLFEPPVDTKMMQVPIIFSLDDNISGPTTKKTSEDAERFRD